MKNRTTFFVSRKNWLTWIMALLFAASAAARITLACVKGTGGSGFVWGQVILPAAACLLYVLISLLRGQERFYRTAIPVFMLALYFCIYTRTALPEMGTSFWILYCFMYFTLAVFYAAVACGKIKQYYLLFFVYMIPLAFRLVSYREHMAFGYVVNAIWNHIPDTLLLAGLIFSIFAMQVHADGKHHPTWGDRSDGRLIRTLPPMSQVSPYIMVNRNDADNTYEESIEITNLERYIRAKRREGLENFGLNHVFIAAYLRGLCQFPALNRFISGQKVYSRDDEVLYVMTVKKEMSVDSPDSSIKLHLNRGDTTKDVYEKFNEAVAEIRNADLNDDLDSTAKALTLIPGVILKFVVWLLKLLDYFGLLPKFLLEVSPFHGSVIFTSMGSLGIRPVYHHLYNFGNLPIFCSFGSKRRTNEVLADGTVVQRKYVDMRFTLDERIADGFYYAAFFKHYKRILAHPELLDEKPEEILPDLD